MRHLDQRSEGAIRAGIGGDLTPQLPRGRSPDLHDEALAVFHMTIQRIRSHAEPRGNVSQTPAAPALLFNDHERHRAEPARVYFRRIWHITIVRVLCGSKTNVDSVHFKL